jgi:outer membrane protein TolC
LSWADALRITGEQSPTIASAAARILRSEALVREAAASAYPRLDARAGYVRFIEAADFRGRFGTQVSDNATRTRRFTSRGSDIYSAGVDLSYPIFDGGSTYYDKKATQASLQATRHDFDTVVRELELQVTVAFLDVLLAEGTIEIAEEALSFTEKEEARARTRQEAGESLRVDTLRFATNASEERLALNRARSAKRVRLTILAELLGVPLADDIELVHPGASLDVPGNDAVALGVRNRSEMQAIRARRRQLRHRFSRERSSWWPSVDLFGSYGVLTLDEIKLSDANDEFQIGGALAMNLFEGGATAARTAALRSEIAELDGLREELALRIEREIRESEAELDVARVNVDVSRQTVALAEEVLTSVSARYREGEVQVLDVTEATLQRARARLAYLRSRIELVLSQARLRRAAGLEILTTE